MRWGGVRVVPVGVVLVVLAAGLAAPVIAQSAFVTVPDQNVDMTAEVVADDASLPEGGFLALYRGEDRTGELIGHTDYLSPGQYRDLAVPFDDPFYYTDPDTTHTVVVYRDLDGDESFAEEGAAATDSFVIGSIATPESAPETDSPTASPDAGGPAGGDADEGSATATPGAGDGANQLTADEPGGGPPLWLILVGLLGVVAVGAGLRWRGAVDSGPADRPDTDPDPDAVFETLWTLHDRSGKPIDGRTLAAQLDRGRQAVYGALDELSDDDRVTYVSNPNGGYQPTTPPVAVGGDNGENGTGGSAAAADGNDGNDESDPTGAATESEATATATSRAERATADAAGDTGPTVGSSTNWRGAVPDSVSGAPDISIAYDDLDIGEFVGGGGSADVHRATVETADGSVPLAVKRPRARGTLHTEQVERFVAEAETWAKLDDHDGIVDVVGWGSEPLPWLAMEYMDGGHLGERAGDVDLAEGLWIAVSIAKAVRHAHRRGVAHLDLKPANVLFRTTDGGWDAPKVADWGLSKQLLEHSASVEGMTPHYAAPEQFDDGYGAADDITDVYGLGAVYYALFTGRPPFEGRPSEVMNAVLTETPASPSEVADVSPALDEVLLTALATEKADRHESVLYLRDDLQGLLDGL